MRNTWLVFLRDYLGYVKAWGFWLGVLSTPLIILVVVGIMVLNETNQPTRYFTVLETDGVYQTAIQSEFDERATRVARTILEEQAKLDLLDPSVVDDFNAAVERGLPAKEALEQIDAPAGVSVPEAKFIYVPPPAGSAEALKPWLLGDRQVQGPDGEKELFAAIIPTAEGVEYWSENVTVGALKSRVEEAAERLAREQVFAAEGVDTAIIKRAREAAPEILERRARPEGEEAAGDEVTLADRAPFYAAVAIAYVLWLMIFSVIQYLLMGTIEERSNKIFDTLLTSVKLPQLLAGKLGAVFALTVTLMLSWTLASTLIFGFVGSNLPADVSTEFGTALGAALSPSIVIPAFISFVVGYIMYGAIFIAIGSLCDTIQEAQTLLSPMMILLMLPMLMIVISFNDVESPIVAAFSWVPLFTPFLLILKMPAEPPLWEVLTQIGIMVAVAAIVLWAATKVYRAGAVHGASMSDAMDWLKSWIPGMGGKKTKEVEV